MTSPQGEAPRFDLVVVGAGAAGLWAALCAAERGGSVCLVSRKPLAESASFRAQGGLAAALAPDDSPEQHAADTIAAGRGLCRTAAVETMAAEAPALVEDLVARGMRFDRDRGGGLALGLEGGHGHRRIVHAGGSETGKEITGALARMVAEQDGVLVMEETSAMALWSDGSRCCGVITDRGRIQGRSTLLATGGAAALWRRTSNPWGAIGAGAVLAHAAGAELADLEFCQFHPTALSAPDSELDGGLITEAVRGEGAVLLDSAGQRFTDELAPRDAVTAAILDKMEEEGTRQVRLDLSSVPPERFPNVFRMVERAGFDPSAEPIPIAPAAHYMMGGVAVDLDGRSSLDGLYAAGECACTGLHGANRLASNSLTECFVFGRRAALAALEEPDCEPPAVPGWEFDPPTVETRASVWRLAGPLRVADELERLSHDRYPLAAAIGSCALSREETRGGHRRTDAKATDPALDGVHLIYMPDGSIERRTWG